MILRTRRTVIIPEITVNDILRILSTCNRDQKIQSIKKIRSEYQIGLKEAKDLVEQGWAFLDIVENITFPITEEELVQTFNKGKWEQGNDPSNYGVYADEESFNTQAFENDSHDELPW